jgi:hypothetical protein
MIETAILVKKTGYAVFVPCLDILLGIQSGEFEYEDYFQNSQPWLVCCDAVMLTPGWETSKGTAREIELAKSLNIPVFDDLGTMKCFIK